MLLCYRNSITSSRETFPGLGGGRSVIAENLLLLYAPSGGRKPGPKDHGVRPEWHFLKLQYFVF